MDDYYTHPSVIIDAGAEVGKRTKIWHFTHIMSGCIIGDDCTLGQNVFVARNVRIGHRVKIQNNVSVYSGVICEDDVFLGPSMVFTNVLNPRSAVNRKAEFKPTLVKKGATIGANATILCGIEIGQYAFVGAGAVVTRSVPDFGLVVGNPGELKGWMSRQGHTLHFQSDGIAICRESGEKYHFDSNNKVIRLST